MLITTYGGVENFLSPSQIPEDELSKRTTIVRQGICHFLCKKKFYFIFFFFDILNFNHLNSNKKQ